MLPRLVPKIAPLYTFCDVVGVVVVAVVVVVGVVVGIGDSRSWICIVAVLPNLHVRCYAAALQFKMSKKFHYEAEAEAALLYKM